MSIAYPDVNGHRTSYCSIELGIDGTKIKGVKSINYRSPVEVGSVMGTSANRQGRTRGTVKHEGDLEIYQAEWEEILLPKLTKNGAIGFSEAAVTLAVTYSEKIAVTKTVTDRLVGVRFLSPEKSNSEGTDALLVKVTLDIMDIFYQSKYRALR